MTATQTGTLLAALTALAGDWDANGNSRPLGDPTAETWHKAARQLRAALVATAPVDTTGLAERLEALCVEAEQRATGSWGKSVGVTAIRAALELSSEDSTSPTCPTREPEPHLLGEFPMTCYRCHIEADS